VFCFEDSLEYHSEKMETLPVEIMQ